MKTNGPRVVGRRRGARQRAFRIAGHRRRRHGRHEILQPDPRNAVESVGHPGQRQALNIGTTDLDKLNVKRIKL